eukprot:1144988-Pelagomonas_calceolata.AAC.4
MRFSRAHCLQVSNDAGLSSDPQSVTRTIFVAAKCGSGMASCDNGECAEGGARLPGSVCVCVCERERERMKKPRGHPCA